jgi:radical SAM protein with 4Fe4S-binding SPASM domain
MNAIDITKQAPNGERQRLEDILPLNTPLVIQIFPVYSCNLKCNYCIFQKPKEERPFISDVISMNPENYYKYIRDMMKFPQKLKVLRFVGIGEPLLHKNLPDMISYAKHKKVANKIEIITNGIKLRPALSDALIESGFDKIEISVQGIDSLDYKNNAGNSLYFDGFLYNIGYLYRYKKKHQKIYIKIVDSALKNKDKFLNLFGDLCDYIGIESTVPIHEGVDLPERDKTQFGQSIVKSDVCSQPFYHMQINPDGKVTPCYSFDYPVILGNANKQSIVDIWNGKPFNDFRLNHVKNETCKKCQMSKYRMFEEDKISMEKVKEIYIAE